ncbi:hypothetical protein Pint_30360 [Pistacia integerrima]|uniref:Uncharacterized protein n=1 Tax=Pistacia integerrima TaxID=434235 RepID=A0ACC0X075_9ROSI|nr:hypothetical protein Pint_30360 [Pistacia integerrima]
MEVRFLAWFLFILCTLCLTCLGFEGFPTSKVEDFNLTEPKFGGQLHVRHAAANISIGLYAESERRGLEGNHDIINERKGQKGKGTYGGGNPAHHPRKNRSPASLSSSICFMSTAVINISLAAFLVILLLGVF